MECAVPDGNHSGRTDSAGLITRRNVQGSICFFSTPGVGEPETDIPPRVAQDLPIGDACERHLPVLPRTRRLDSPRLHDGVHPPVFPTRFRVEPE